MFWAECWGRAVRTGRAALPRAHQPSVPGWRRCWASGSRVDRDLGSGLEVLVESGPGE